MYGMQNNKLEEFEGENWEHFSRIWMSIWVSRISSWIRIKNVNVTKVMYRNFRNMCDKLDKCGLHESPN